MFNAVISLGGVCEPAMHAIRYFGGRKTNSPFDFTVTPLTAVAQVLADDGERLGTEFEITQQGTNVRCPRYGILYHHELQRAPETGMVTFTTSLVEACHVKLVHKYRAMIEAAQCSKPLFVRMQTATNAPDDPLQRRAATYDDFAKIESAIEARIGHGDYRVVLINLIGDAPWGTRYDGQLALSEPPPHTRIVTRQVAPDQTEADAITWWDEFFRLHGLRPDQDLIGATDKEL